MKTRESFWFSTGCVACWLSAGFAALNAMGYTDRQWYIVLAPVMVWLALYAVGLILAAILERIGGGDD